MSTVAPSSSTARTTLRVVGAVLVVLGSGLVVHTFSWLLPALDSGEDPGAGAAVRLAAGGFSFVIGLGLLNAGFLGAQARYSAQETAPALRAAGAAWRGDGARPASYCSQCGAGARSGARFCDACGHGLG